MCKIAICAKVQKVAGKPKGATYDSLQIFIALQSIQNVQYNPLRTQYAVPATRPLLVLTQWISNDNGNPILD